MESKTYYDILGVSVKAAPDEIIAAKNALAKKYHPDANLKDGIDTTYQMQEILEAYRVLSDPDKRSEYDRKIAGQRKQMQTFDLHEMEEETEDPEHPTFVTYWKAAGALYDIIIRSDELIRQRDATAKLGELAMQALRYIVQLRNAEIPERYWHPDIMNWLLFKWYQNRNYNISYLLTLYDEHTNTEMSKIDRLKVQGKSYRYQHSVKKLLKY